MTCYTDSCTGRMSAAADCLFTPVASAYSAVASVAQKIADFVTGIFAAIANFVRDCLGMASEHAAPVPAHRGPIVSANILPATPAIPAIPASTDTLPATIIPASIPATHTLPPTLSAPVTAVRAPAINQALIESGKTLLHGLGIANDQAHFKNQFRDRLDTEVSSRLAFATVLIHAAIVLHISNLRPIIQFVKECNVPPDYAPMVDLFRLKKSYALLDEPSQQLALQVLKNAHPTEQQLNTAAADFLREANRIRERFTQDPIFCAAAEAARAELQTHGATH